MASFDASFAINERSHIVMSYRRFHSPFTIISHKFSTSTNTVHCIEHLEY